MLPKDFPKWQSVYYYFRLWRKENEWQCLHDTLRAEVRLGIGTPQTSDGWMPRQPKRENNARAGHTRRATRRKTSHGANVTFWSTRSAC